MAKFIVEVDIDGDAFNPRASEALERAYATVEPGALHDVLLNISKQAYRGTIAGSVRDANGNTCAKFWLDEEDGK